ncbi:hypothetical protein M407DRAFT_93101 [Tulasnella calospora MUT 4182]|uniref:Tetratricopeptide repeat protein 29 n=1 Tax=Tulasnella calospora MUT 4182 TaxID=1051891 RepID=A0A0C3KUT9_9AGAM|nr:hypothetical protein M407DRAFT_93101 [Tulasnella calospora MUT 4182]
MDQAISTFQKAHEIARNIGWEQGLSTCLCRLGSIKVQQGLHAEAEELLRESVRVARSSDDVWRLAQALHWSGKCFKEQGRFEEALSALEESCSAYQNLALDFESELANTAVLLADLNSEHGHKEDALARYDRAIAEWRKGGDKAEISKCLAWKAVILVDINRCDEGALHFEASLIIDQESRDEAGVQWNREQLSGIPKTVIKSEVGRQSRLALAKLQSLRSTSLLCDMKKLQRRVPQLTMPNLKSPVKLVNESGL